MRRDSHRAIAMDSEGHELRIGDNVKEVDGEVCRCGTFLPSFIVNQLRRDAKAESCTLTNRSSPSFTIVTSLRTAVCLSLVRGPWRH